MTLSLAITTFNRFEMTVESFSQVLDDQRINDIVILDDCSTDGSYEKLVKHFNGVDKVRVIRQAKNRGMSLNKRDAIGYCRNSWVIIFDSDNIIGPSYLDAIESWGIYPGLHNMNPETFYLPDFAKPAYDYRKFLGDVYNKHNIVDLLNYSMGDCLLNTCNCLVHRDSYLKVYEHNPDMKGTDTIWMSYLWLKSGRSFQVIRNMQYFHRVHNGSGFIKDLGYNMKQAEKVKKMILSL